MVNKSFTSFALGWPIVYGRVNHLGSRYVTAHLWGRWIEQRVSTSTTGTGFVALCQGQSIKTIPHLVPCEGFHVNAPICGSHSWVQWTRGVL